MLMVTSPEGILVSRSQHPITRRIGVMWVDCKTSASQTYVTSKGKHSLRSMCGRLSSPDSKRNRKCLVAREKLRIHLPLWSGTMASPLCPHLWPTRRRKAPPADLSSLSVAVLLPFSMLRSALCAWPPLCFFTEETL